jgi:type IV pilus assembly protein PilB
MEPPRRRGDIGTMTAPHRTPGPLGQVLLALGAIAEEELNAALTEQRRNGERIGAILVRRGLDEEHVARALARQLRLPHASPPLQPDPAAVRLVDGAAAARLRVVPLAATDRTLRVAMSDPLDAAAMDDLRFRTGRRIEPVVASRTAVEGAIVGAYHADAVDEVLTRLPAGAPAQARDRPAAGGDDGVDSLRRASEAPPVVALVDLILARAVQQRASDVHLEPVAARCACASGWTA